MRPISLPLLLPMALLCGSAAAQPRPVLMDVDPGIDDALALLLATRSPEIDLVGVTVVAGNVPVDTGARNARQILELAGRDDVPVARGAERPLVGALMTSEHVHGANGLGGIELPAPRRALEPGGAVDLIARAAEEHAGRLVLVPVGPLTNVALALRLVPGLAERIERIVLMGGAVAGGNVTAVAEFNIFNDPEAAAIVFASGVPIVMVGLDVTLRCVLRPETLASAPAPAEGPAGAVGRFVRRLLAEHPRAESAEGIVLHDPLAVAVAVDASLVRLEPRRVAVETAGALTRGQTVADARPYRLSFEERDGRRRALREPALPPNAEVALDVDAERFLRFFVERVLGAPAR